MRYRAARLSGREQEERLLALALGGLALLMAAAQPGVAVGAAIAAVLMARLHTGYMWAATFFGLDVAYAGAGWITPGWAWHDAIPLLPTADALHAARSFVVELFAGPAVLQLLAGARWLQMRTLLPNLRQEERLRRESAVVHTMSVRGPMATAAHPNGSIRLGIEVGSSRPFDLHPRELTQHVFLPGASGSGKTTTLSRLADGALGIGYGVVIVDCKAGGLGGAARSLAQRRHVPFLAVDPDDPESAGYNPCEGDPSSVANKLLGAFTYGPNAEIFKLAAGQAIPPIVRALLAAGEPVTLNSVSAALRPGGLAQLGRRAGEDHRAVLSDLEADRKGGNSLAEQAYTGLGYRLAMLREGRFGPLFELPPLIWDEVLSRPSVTYLGLSATAASEDVELLGRVILQDLKQAAGRRLARIAKGEQLPPVLVILDEFAALREAPQIVDLLLQARQALLQVVVSTQYLPEDIAVRKACLSAGLIIAHRVEGEDAEVIAGQYGTRATFKTTLQWSRETGQSDQGSWREVDEYRIHPNVLRELPVGRAAIRSVLRDDGRGGPRIEPKVVAVYREGTLT